MDLVLMAIVRSCILWIKSWCNKNAARGKRTTSIKEPELFACWWEYRKELAMELPINLFIWKLVGLHRLAWRSLNQAVSLSLKRCGPGSVADVFQVYSANGFWFASHLGDICFHSSDWLRVSIHQTSFSLHFSKLSV